MWGVQKTILMIVAVVIVVGCGESSPTVEIDDYIMEKAFMYGCIAMSKWLGPDRWPHMIFKEWPPTPTP